MSRGRVLCAPEALRNAFFFFSCCLLPWLVAPYINAQAKHVLIIMEIGLGYFYVLLLRFPHTHTITRMVEAENANSFSSPPSSTEVLCSYGLSFFLQT